jgi:hypothetical protein
MTHLTAVFADEPGRPDESSDDPQGMPSEVVPFLKEGHHGSAADGRPWRLLEERRLDPHRPAVGTYRRTTDFRVSRTDPAAAPMRTSSGTALGYHDH